MPIPGILRAEVPLLIYIRADRANSRADRAIGYVLVARRVVRAFEPRQLKPFTCLTKYYIDVIILV
jgi:hypothetical protein